MIDDKKIEAAKEEIYEDRFLLNGEEVVFDNDAKEEMFYKEDIKEAIGLGARWMQEEFLKDLWHPAEEEPNHEAIRTYILGKTEASESGLLPMLLRPNTNWKEFVVSHGVTNWLYADDILPKKRRRREMKENKNSLKISRSFFGDTTLDGYPIVTYSNNELKILKNLLTRVLGEVNEYIKN